jgi:hypothetical protein
MEEMVRDSQGSFSQFFNNTVLEVIERVNQCGQLYYSDFE